MQGRQILIGITEARSRLAGPIAMRWHSGYRSTDPAPTKDQPNRKALAEVRPDPQAVAQRRGRQPRRRRTAASRQVAASGGVLLPQPRTAFPGDAARGAVRDERSSGRCGGRRRGRLPAGLAPLRGTDGGRPRSLARAALPGPHLLRTRAVPAACPRRPGQDPTAALPIDRGAAAVRSVRPKRGRLRRMPAAVWLELHRRRSTKTHNNQ